MLNDYLPPWAQQPSPALFAIAWAVFAVSAARLYLSHKNDQRQNQILGVIILLGILGGLVISERSFVTVLGTYLPIFVSLGLFSSILVHNLRILQAADGGQEGLEQEESFSEKGRVGGRS
jgi:hypothetical protein